MLKSGFNSPRLYHMECLQEIGQFFLCCSIVVGVSLYRNAIIFLNLIRRQKCETLVETVVIMKST